MAGCVFRRNMGLFPFATRFSRALQLAFVANARPTISSPSASTTLENLRNVLLSSPPSRDTLISKRLSNRFNVHNRVIGLSVKWKIYINFRALVSPSSQQNNQSSKIFRVVKFMARIYLSLAFTVGRNYRLNAISLV